MMQIHCSTASFSSHRSDHLPLQPSSCSLWASQVDLMFPAPPPHRAPSVRTMVGFIPSLGLHRNSSSQVRTSFLAGSQVPLKRSPPIRRAFMQRVTVTCQQSGDLAVMVNGVPGKMATSTAEEVIRRGLTLADEALTGPGMDTEVTIGSQTVNLAPPEDHTHCLHRMRDKYQNLVIVDYTHPSAANPNVDKYSQAGISFVIGTTGGDVPAMKSAAEKAGVYAVIAPNMGKQIVAFQAMMDMMAREFPGAFSGYKMTVKESHQSTKADTSGTAKSVVSSFTKLGLDFDVDQIEKVRDSRKSISEMHVPEQFVTAGHAFHTYHLTSADGTVDFEFQHNVCGRNIYAAGTVDAVFFLNARKREGDSKRIFDMIDILRSGEMS